MMVGERVNTLAWRCRRRWRTNESRQPLPTQIRRRVIGVICPRGNKSNGQFIKRQQCPFSSFSSRPAFTTCTPSTHPFYRETFNFSFRFRLPLPLFHSASHRRRLLFRSFGYLFPAYLPSPSTHKKITTVLPGHVSYLKSTEIGQQEAPKEYRTHS